MKWSFARFDAGTQYFSGVCINKLPGSSALQIFLRLYHEGLFGVRYFRFDRLRYGTRRRGNWLVHFTLYILHN